MRLPRTCVGLLVVGWALLYSRHGREWRVIDRFAYPNHCQQVLDEHVDRETQREIGGALAVQTADNPLRQAAYARAARQVRERYRCERDD